MIFIFPTPAYPRRPLEYVYKMLYLFCTLMHIIGISVLITDFYTRLTSSMPNYYTSGTPTISDSIRLVMRNCTYSGSVKINGARAMVNVTEGNIAYGLLTTAQYVTALFVVEFLMVVNNGCCASNYSSGNRHLRLFGMHIPYYHITVAFSYFYSIVIIVLTWVYESHRLFYRDAVRWCANKTWAEDPERLLNGEYDDYDIFTTAVYWPFAVTCFTLVVYLSAVAVLCWNSEDEATLLMSESNAPWEHRSIFCTTNKPILRLHTTQRNAIMDDARKALQSGQKVRIVRSYQLMTEEDFALLEQAMKDQVAQMMKEKQFQKLKENFGDRESQIDEGGLMWRNAMPWVLPSSDEEADPLEFTNNEVYPLDELQYGADNAAPQPYPMDEAVDNENIMLDEFGEPIVLPEEPGYDGGDDIPIEEDMPYDDEPRSHHHHRRHSRRRHDRNNKEEIEEDNYDDDDDDRGSRTLDRRHRRRRGADDYDESPFYDNELDEPLPRSPVGDEFTPAEWNTPSSRRGGGYNNNNNNNNNNVNSRNDGRGRRSYQAQVDNDYVEGDEVSGDFF